MWKQYISHFQPREGPSCLLCKLREGSFTVLVVTEEHEAAGEEDGVAEAGVLEVEDGHHEHEECDGAPVGEERDGGGAPGGVEQRDHVHHRAPGVPHAALEHGQQREHS